ncbi:hypothetical protein JTE90_005726, partial [Oedothorax gibbosus]
MYNITHKQTFTQISPAARRDSPKVPIDVCSLRSQRGTCNNNTLRHFYHSFTGKCFPFIYSGCDGNGNNFLSAEECMQRCGRSKSTSRIFSSIFTEETDFQGPQVKQGDVCSLLPDRDIVEEIHTDTTTTKMRGNVCHSSMEDVQETQIGSSQNRSVFSGVVTREVLQPKAFRTGCDGNENRFSSEDLCMLACGRNKATTTVSTMTQTVEVEEESINNTDACDLPVARGNCNNNSQRYFFNNLSGQCLQLLIVDAEETLIILSRKKVANNGVGKLK